MYVVHFEVSNQNFDDQKKLAQMDSYINPV